MPRSIFGISRVGPGKWASCIRVLNTTEGQTLSILELDNNEAALSVCTITFHDRDELFLAVGTAKDLQLQETAPFRRSRSPPGHTHVRARARAHTSSSTHATHAFSKTTHHTYRGTRIHARLH